MIILMRILSFKKFDWSRLWCVHFQVSGLQWSNMSSWNLRVKLVHFFCSGIYLIFIYILFYNKMSSKLLLDGHTVWYKQNLFRFI